MSNVLGNCQECGEMKPCDCGFGGFNADADPTPAEALKACPNPWCVPSDELPPTLHWTLSGASEAFIECASCGMVGPSVSPVYYDEDGAKIGNRDAEVAAIAAWNTRPPPPDAGEVRTFRDGVEDAARVCDARADDWRASIVGQTVAGALNASRIAIDFTDTAAAIRKLP